MKSLDQFKQEPTLVEEEKSDYSKFDALVRAGLANKTQLNRIHRILDKMQEERPQFNNADKQIMQNLFNKMADLITNNKQIYQKSRQAVREGLELEEGLMDTSDYKISPSGRKIRAHRVKIGDTNSNMLDKEKDNIKEAKDPNKEPPFVLVLKRTGIRLYPNGLKVAIYYNQKMDKYFSVPYGQGVDATIQAEEIELDESVNVVDNLQKIKDTHQHGTINHKDGSASKIDVQTAHAILSVHKALNDENKKKFSDMMARSNHHMKKAADFAWNKVK
jgi:hypothetical protein